MKDNFGNQLEELQKQINELKKEADKLQKSSPENAIMNARKALEAICKHICMKFGLIKSKESMHMFTLSKMIYLIEEKGKAPAHIVEDMRFIQKKGNIVAHSIQKTNPEDATPVLYALTNLVNWYFSGTTAQPKAKEKPEDFVKPEKKTEQELLKEKISSTFKKPWFTTVATAVMAATGTAIAAKVFKK
jgi:cell division septum initiation protein DivIVA